MAESSSKVALLPKREMEKEASKRKSSGKPPQRVTIDPNVGLPSVEPNADEPSGIWYTMRKSIRGFWATRETEDTATNRELYVRTTLRELLVYSLFLSSTLVITFGATSSTMYYLTDAIEKSFKIEEFKTQSNFDDVYGYYKTTMLDGMHWDEWYNNKSTAVSGKHNNIYYANKMLGAPRIRQLKVKNGTCPIATEFNGIVFTCFGEYTTDREETRAFGLNTSAAWIYQTEEQTKMRSYWGKLTTYGGGGYIQDLNRTKSESLRQITILQQNRWLSQSTRAVFVDFTLYNPNLNLFATIRLLTECAPTGGIINSANIRVTKFIRYLTNGDYAVLVFECLFTCFIIYYVGEEIIEISKLKRRYFRSFWNILDLTVLVAGICCIGFSIYRYMLVAETLEGILLRSEQFEDFEYLSYYEVTLNNALAVTVFLAWIKIFKYLSFNKTMMQLSSTLARAAKDVASFAIMFFVVFFAFAQLGFFLFGTQLGDFRDVGQTAFTLLLIILGAFDFPALQAANRVMGPIFFFMYIFFVFFVLLNMFLAIINETYAAVKEDLANKRNDFEIGDYIKKGFDKVLKALHLRKIKQQKGQEKAVIEEKVLKHRALVELTKWQDDLNNRGYTPEEIAAVFGSGALPAQKQEDDSKGGVDPEVVAKLEKRVRKLEASLLSILSNFDTALAKIEIMERSKITRARKLEAVIDKLDGGTFLKNERKDDLTQEALKTKVKQK